MSFDPSDIVHISSPDWQAARTGVDGSFLSYAPGEKFPLIVGGDPIVNDTVTYIVQRTSVPERRAIKHYWQIINEGFEELISGKRKRIAEETKDAIRALAPVMNELVQLFAHRAAYRNNVYWSYVGIRSRPRPQWTPPFHVNGNIRRSIRFAARNPPKMMSDKNIRFLLETPGLGKQLLEYISPEWFANVTVDPPSWGRHATTWLPEEFVRRCKKFTTLNKLHVMCGQFWNYYLEMQHRMCAYLRDGISNEYQQSHDLYHTDQKTAVHLADALFRGINLPYQLCKEESKWYVLYIQKSYCCWEKEYNMYLDGQPVTAHVFNKMFPDLPASGLRGCFWVNGAAPMRSRNFWMYLPQWQWTSHPICPFPQLITGPEVPILMGKFNAWSTPTMWRPHLWNYPIDEEEFDDEEEDDDMSDDSWLACQETLPEHLTL